MELSKEALKYLIEATELKGQIKYNLDMNSSRIHKRSLLVNQYRDEIKEKLRPYREEIGEINETMKWFENIIAAPDYKPS